MTEKLLAWYDKNQRELPWRLRGGVYAVLVSEMMLQQTTVETVLRYYAPFMQRFPDIQALAAASEQQVLTAWQGLGYYARARSLHRIAWQIDERGAFPETHEAWLSLTGVGPYMAAAVMSIAFGLPYAAVDGNVMRVISRLYALSEDITRPSAKKAVTEHVQVLISASRAGDFTQALMELGALVCRPVSPACDACPLAAECLAYEQGVTDQIPVRAPRQKQRIVRLWVAVIEAQDSVALEYRDKHKLLARLYGLPVAEKDDGNTPEALFERAYGIALPRGEQAGSAVHVFTHLRWEMDILRFVLDERTELPAAWEWTSWAQISEKPIPAAFKKVLDIIRKEDK